ncbi:MAG: ribbon-helix-helix protein, CopG family [Ruminococcus sp.]|nr:ribbon-helix-helix protein, CopG family [Ruminococcus sp.]
MKKEIEIPSQYLETIMAEAEKRGVSADEIVETAIRKFLERSKTDAE